MLTATTPLRQLRPRLPHVAASVPSRDRSGGRRRERFRGRSSQIPQKAAGDGGWRWPLGRAVQAGAEELHSDLRRLLPPRVRCRLEILTPASRRGLVMLTRTRCRLSRRQAQPLIGG